jgi:hypothetical protein
MPKLNEFGDKYPRIGHVWMKGITPEEEEPVMHTTTEYPPSVIDDSP